MRLLIDECLSPALLEVAHQYGVEAYHVAHRGLSGAKDHAILRLMLEQGFTLVTNNRDDFLALIGDAELHPGLIVILPNVSRADQIRLFELALREAIAGKSLINRVVEIDAHGIVGVYELPR